MNRADLLYIVFHRRQDQEKGYYTKGYTEDWLCD